MVFIHSFFQLRGTPGPAAVHIWDRRFPIYFLLACRSLSGDDDTGVMRGLGQKYLSIG